MLLGNAEAAEPKRSISQFTHTSWSAKDGIPGPVRAIAQTPDGYLWLGTAAGLYRFDGVHFVQWKAASGEQLPSSSVWALCTARDGSLWIAFGVGGISQLRDGRLRNYSPGQGVPDGGVLSIVEDASGSIWAGGQYGFSKFEGATWRRIGAQAGYSAPGAQALFVDHRGTLWAATDGLNYGFSKDPVLRNTILTLAPNDKQFRATGQAIGMVRSMAEAPDGDVWIGHISEDRVRPAVAKTASTPGVALDDSPVCLLFDDHKSLWVGLIGLGLRRTFDLNRSGTNGGTVDHFDTTDGLSAGSVNSTFKDREGNIWFGTMGGLDRFRENKVEPFSAREGLSPDQQVALTSATDGAVWIVSYTNDSVRLASRGRFMASQLPPYSRTDSTRILSLFSDRAGSAWVGGNFGLAKETGGQVSYVHAADIEKGANVEAIAIDASGGLWIAETSWNTDTGIESKPKVLRFENGEWTDFSTLAVLPNYKSRVLYGDPQGRMWLGFENGEVAAYERGEFHRYTSVDGLPRGRVFTITSDLDGDIWIGGEGGLSRFDHGHFVTLSQDNGLPGTSVSGIVQDGDGFLWLACALGIFRVDRQELGKALASRSYQLQGMTIGASDGLRGLPRQKEPFPVAARADDGRLWFATTGGVAVIDPRRLPTNRVPPPVVIESVNADEQVLPASSGMHLQPRTRNLEFSYAALSLTDSEKVRFRYRLEGYDDTWRGPTNARQVAYTNLPPRDYRFRLIACNNDGVWNEEGAALTFTILPTFYQTGWFRLSAVLMFAGMGWAAYGMRLKLVARRLNARFEERLAERTRIAQELHDTLLQGFVSASMQLHVATDRLPTDSPAKPSLGRVLDLMGRVIEEGRNAVRGLRAPGSPSHDLEGAFSGIANELGSEGHTEYHVIVEGRARPLNPMIRDDVYRIGREAVVNAFRHSGAKRIELDLEYASGGLRMLIRDNGDGIDPQVLRSGSEGHWGLSGMRERAERIGGRFKVWSGPSAGSEIELFVPGRVAFMSGRSDRWRWVRPMWARIGAARRDDRMRKNQ